MDNQHNPPVDDLVKPPNTETLPKPNRRAQISAANGRKSRGPKTPEGKAISARNIILDGESAERFTALLHALYAEFQPETTVEKALVDTMVIAHWRQLRLWTLEKASLDHEIHRNEPENPTENIVTRAALAFRALSDTSRSLELIHRYETRCDRQFTRAVQRFFDLRDRRRIDLRNAEPAPSIPEK